jgi:mono/diheme cytochrome c family protein
VKQHRQIEFFSILTVVGMCAVLSAGSMARSQQPGIQATAQEAEETFQIRCSTCHAEHGEGSEVGASLNVPDLRSASVQKNADAELRQVIKNGRGNMPAFGRDFSDQQIDRILQLVRRFAVRANEEAQTKSPAR